MKTGTWIVAGALLTAFTINAADKEAQKERRERQAVRAEKQEARETKGDIDKRIAAINRLDNNKPSLMAGMAAVSKETAVPLPKIEAEHKEHPNVGLAGLFVAHDLAVRTHKGVEHFLDARKKGRSWAEIAKANGVNADELEAKLNRIEDAMRNAK
ncbi:MAG TPA: hypothetical protein VNT99_09395 [Methylomirabilota bacterium]|nr:hypothetical protein [Methylomirabilota bacterium]